MGSQPSTYKTNEYFIVHSDRLKGINWFSKVPQLYITDFATISQRTLHCTTFCYISQNQPQYISVLYTVQPSVIYHRFSHNILAYFTLYNLLLYITDLATISAYFTLYNLLLYITDVATISAYFTLYNLLLYITDFATISAYFTLYNLLLYIKILQHYLSVLYTVPPSVVCLIFLTNQLSVSVTEHSTVVDVLERIIYYRTQNSCRCFVTYYILQNIVQLQMFCNVLYITEHSTIVDVL